MASAAYASLRHLGEQSFHQVQPTATRGREVDVIARVTRQPRSYLADPVGAVVVHDQVDFKTAREIGFDVVEEAAGTPDADAGDSNC